MVIDGRRGINGVKNMDSKGKKSALKLSIDSEIVKEAKETIPNISKYVEGCLKIAIQSQNKDENKIKLEIEAKEQTRVQLDQELEVLRAQLSNHRHFNNDKNEQKGLAWRRLLSHYREYGGTHPKLMNPAIELLKVDEETLKYVLERVKWNINPKNAENMRDWDYVKEHYIQGECENGEN